jgi:hypothetical protein
MAAIRLFVMPVGAAILLGCVVLASLVAIVVICRSDRRRLLGAAHGSRASVTSGRCSTCVAVPTQLDRAAALGVAKEVLVDMVGLSEVAMWDEQTVTAFTPTPLLGLGWAPQQLSIVVEPVAVGATRLICCSRPRHATALNDAGRSDQTARELARRTTLACQGR